MQHLLLNLVYFQAVIPVKQEGTELLLLTIRHKQIKLPGWQSLCWTWNKLTERNILLSLARAHIPAEPVQQTGFEPKNYSGACLVGNSKVSRVGSKFLWEKRVQHFEEFFKKARNILLGLTSCWTWDTGPAKGRGIRTPSFDWKRWADAFRAPAPAPQGWSGTGMALGGSGFMEGSHMVCSVNVLPVGSPIHPFHPLL